MAAVTTTLSAPPESLRANLAAAIQRRAATTSTVQSCKKNTAAAAEVVDVARRKLAQFDTLERRIARWRADELKAGDTAGELPADLQQEKQARALAQESLREAEGVLDLLQTELNGAREEDDATLRHLRMTAVEVWLTEAEQKAVVVLQLYDQLCAAYYLIASIPANLTPGRPPSVSPLVARACGIPIGVLSEGRSASDQVAARWTNFFDALCQDADAQFAPAGLAP